MMDTEFGDVQETFRSEMKVDFEWRIRNILSLRKSQYGSYYTSPCVSFMGKVWWLKMYPNGSYRSRREWISIGIKENKLETSVLFRFGFKLADGTKKEADRDNIFDRSDSYYFQDTFLRWSELSNYKWQLAPSDIFTVTCQIWCNESHPLKAKTMLSRETQTENVSDTGSRAEELTDLDIKGLVILGKNLKNLLLDGNDHDVTFKVKDQEFRAHRSMLRARSPVFAAMFTHAMKESTDDPIDIVDSSPEAFAEFLQYVYTGKVENLSPNIALGLYYAGDKYDVSGLKEVCVQFLNTSLSTTVICDVITLAAKYGEEELYDRAMAFFSDHLEEIMITKEWRSFLAENLDQANKMCLNVLKDLKASK